MRIISGKEVLETAEELIQAHHSALLLVDIQNDYVAEGGLLHQLGYDIAPMQGMVATVRRLTDSARVAQVPIIYLQDTRLPESKSESAPVLRFITMKCGLPPDVTLQGTWGWQITEQIAPESTDIVIPKFRESGFVGTALDRILRSNGIQTLVMTGDVTQGCLESTARDALFHDYYVVIVRDGVASHLPDLHEASMNVMERKFDVVDADDVIAIWSPEFVPAPITS